MVACVRTTNDESLTNTTPQVYGLALLRWETNAHQESCMCIQANAAIPIDALELTPQQPHHKTEGRVGGEIIAVKQQWCAVHTCLRWHAVIYIPPRARAVQHMVRIKGKGMRDSYDTTSTLSQNSYGATMKTVTADRHKQSNTERSPNALYLVVPICDRP